MAIFRQYDGDSGFAMIEALIAIVVISFGLLGLASLQLSGMRVSQVAYYRSVATTQAYDMADRMRANAVGVRAGNYNNITSTIPARPSCSNPFAVGAGCTSANMATYDVYAWLSENSRLLPGGGGTVTKLANSNAFNIVVQWTEKCSTGQTSCTNGSLTQSFTTRFVP